jgi:mRNA interferase RelE/StbE
MADAYKVRFRSRSVRKELDSLDDEMYLRIVAAIHRLRENPRPPSIKKLTGQEVYRIRLGDYRVLYSVDDTIREVRIEAVRKRDERTYG